MPSSDEEFELNYGIEDEEEGNQNLEQNGDYDEQVDGKSYVEPVCVPKYDKNPKTKNLDDGNDLEETTEQEDDENAPLEDLINLIEQEDDSEEQINKSIEGDNNEQLDDLMNLIEQEDTDEKKTKLESTQTSKKFVIKKDKLIKEKITIESQNESTEIEQTKSSISITKISKDEEEAILKEKHSGIRLIKSTFKSELDLNVHLSCDYGKYIRLTDLLRRMDELKDSKDSDWFSIFVIGSKTESKCSAKGNNYVIWQIFDLNNLERQQEISLFLFGSAYKSHWKSNEFECFALIKPEFLDSGKNGTQSNSNKNQGSTYFNPNAPLAQTGKKGAQKSDWNKFASKKVNQNLKLSLSIKSESQLVKIGLAKDISNCQSYIKPNPNQPNQESTKKCKNLVNLQQAPFCVYHCIQKDKNKAFQSNNGKYSMNKPSVNRFGETSLFSSNVNSADFKFAPPNRNISSLNRHTEYEKKTKLVQDYKAQVIRSLNSSITKESPLLSNIVLKTNKKSDYEILASLDGKELDQEEVKKIRLAEQATTVKHQVGQNDQASKEMKKLFNSKLLLPSENNITSISSQKLLDIKKSNSLSLPNSPASLLPNSLRVKEKIEENKKNFCLASMNSHRDILKEIKQRKETTGDSKETEIEIQIEESDGNIVKPESSKIVASSFLKKRIEDIKKFSSTPSKKEINQTSVVTKKNTCDFDLELFIGDNVTSKKLMDVNSKYIPFSPSTATSESYKRKLEEMSPSSIKKDETKNQKESLEEKREKRLKLIEEIKNIKSNHSKDASDPDKNPHLRAYYNKLELQDKIDEKLCNMKNREVRVVTCKICAYTAFSQSDFCKLKKHEIRRHMVLQRFFKCKSCNNRTYTLDKICPVSACTKCGNQKFEPCAMKEDTSKDVIINKCSKLDQDSEMFESNLYE